MVANANRSSWRPSGIPRYHAASDHQVSRHQSANKKSRKGALPGDSGIRVPSTGKKEPERVVAAAAAAGKQKLHPSYQEFRKECVLSKRRKFESLISDMRAKKTIPPASSQIMEMDNANRPIQSTFKDGTVTTKLHSHEALRSAGSFFCSRTADHFLPPKVDICRTLSHDSDISDESPFAKLMATSVSSPAPQNMSPYTGTDLQFSMLRIVGAGTQIGGMDPPEPKRYRAHDTYNSLQNLRQKARRNLEKLGVSSRSMPLDQPSQDGSKRIICATARSGDIDATNDSPRLTHGFILGSCTSLFVKEKPMQTMQQEGENEEEKEQQQMEGMLSLPGSPSSTSSKSKGPKESSSILSGDLRVNRSEDKKQHLRVKPPKYKILNSVVETVEETSRNGGETDTLHEGGSKKMGRRNFYSQEKSEDCPDRTTDKNVEAEFPRRMQLKQSSPPASSRNREIYARRSKGGIGEPMVITIYDSELEEKRMRLPSQSHASKTAPTILFDYFQKDVDERILKLRSKLGGQKHNFNEQQPGKVSTFVQDMKQGKNLKESLRHLRQTAKNNRREEIRARREKNEEMVFGDATAKGETADYNKGTAWIRTPPKTALHEVIRAPILSPVTIDAALAQAQSTCASCTSARSNCITKATPDEDFVGTEIKCSDHSVLTDQEKSGFSVTCQDSFGISRVGDDVIDTAGYAADGTLKSRFSRGVRTKEASGTSGILQSGSTNALMSRKKALASSAEGERVLSVASPKPEEYSVEGFPKQISHLLQTVGSQLGPLVPRGVLAMSKPRSPPSKPEWTTQKDVSLEDGVKSLTESMGLLLSGRATPEASKKTVNNRVLELNLRSMEQRVQNGKKAQANCQVGAGPYETQENAGAERNFEIVSSSRIISKFLKRRHQGSRQDFASRVNLDSQRACSVASFAWDIPRKIGSFTGTPASPLAIPVGGALDIDQSALGYGANADVYQGQHFLSQDKRPSLSIELDKKKAFFGKLVSPLTLPSVVGNAAVRCAANTLPPKVPPIDSSNTEQETSPASPIFNGNNATNTVCQAGGQDQWCRSTCSSKSGSLSTSTKRLLRSAYCLSSLRGSTQRSSEESFLTSIVVTDTILENMSSVSDSEEASQFEEETTESASSESSSRTSQKLDPPSIRPMDPSASGKNSDQNYTEMSYSMDSKGESATTDFHTAASGYPLETVAAREDVRGNPLKRLLSRPRFQRRQSRPTHLTRLSVSAQSSCISHSLSREELVEQYSVLQQNPGQFDLNDRAHVNQEDAKDDEIIRLQSWIGNCGGETAGIQKSGLSIRPSLPSDHTGHTDNVDNLVLASWGIKNRMDRLRASLTFSPGNSCSRTLSSVAVTQNMVISNANARDSEIHDNLFPGETGAVSSVSESSTYSTYYGDELGENSRASLSDAYAHDVGKSRTMETDQAYFRGSGANTPKSMLAFKSKSWKLDEDDDTQNSLVASIPSAPSNVSDSGNTSSGERGWKE